MTRPDLNELKRLDATTQAYERLKEGRDFVATTRETGVADDGVAIDAFVGNDTDSEFDLLIAVSFTTGGRADLEMTDGASVDTSGTEMPVQNKGVVNGELPATIETGGTYTTDGTTLETILPGSDRIGGPTINTGSVSIPEGRLLEPGEGVNYVLTNRSGGSTNFSMTVGVIEIDPENYKQ